MPFWSSVAAQRWSFPRGSPRHSLAVAHIAVSFLSTLAQWPFGFFGVRVPLRKKGHSNSGGGVLTNVAEPAKKKKACRFVPMAAGHLSEGSISSFRFVTWFARDGMARPKEQPAGRPTNQVNHYEPPRSYSSGLVCWG